MKPTGSGTFMGQANHNKRKTVRKMISELESGTKEEINLKKMKNGLIPEIFLVPTASGSPGKKRRACLPSSYQARASTAATPASWATGTVRVRQTTLLLTCHTR